MADETGKYDHTFVVIPAKNEARYVPLLLSQLSSLGFNNLVVVNDCSTDETREHAESFPDVVVLDHVINLGPGAATQTGIAYAVSKNAQLIATIDADLQHNPEDLIRLVDHLENEDCDLVIGSRFKKENPIPFSRKVFNQIANVVSYMITGVYLSDSQSGLKIMSKDVAECLDLNYDGFEFCMEIIKQAKVHKHKISEIPIDVRYTPDTTKKGQNLKMGLRIISKLFSPFS